MSTIVAQALESMYIKRVKATDHMRLHTSATQIDFYPVGTGKRFVKRVIWHKGSETEMTSFSTRDKIGMVYDVNGYIANGAVVSDFNLEEYKGKDYSPVYC